MNGNPAVSGSTITVTTATHKVTDGNTLTIAAGSVRMADGHYNTEDIVIVFAGVDAITASGGNVQQSFQ